jgi:light-regulated signal transduction histidine kinase (bacteriophytochrome)
MEISAKGVKESLENYIDLIDNTGKDSQMLTKVYLEKILTKITNTLSSLLNGSKAQIETDFSACETVFFNSAYVESIFLNLITNSIKYTCPGVPPKIEIRTQIKEGQKQLIFKDYGQGFDMEKNGDKIFGLNQRFNETQEGKGVGLYLVHSQLTSLGGDITVESEPEKGATFYITFPN